MTTMRDVANHVGVSIATVSHVINNTRYVSEELRQRIMEAMDELGYQRNALARALRSKQSHTLGVIVPDITNPFFAELTRDIEDIAFAQGFSVILCNSNSDLGKEILHTKHLNEKQVDGVIFVAAGEHSEHIYTLQKRGIATVLIERGGAEDLDAVLIDNKQGGYKATQHLLELGHRHIACIAGPSKHTLRAHRVTGYRQALQDAGVSVREELIVNGDFTTGGGYQLATELLTAVSPPPTAIFACNDLMAMGAIRAARENGYIVPDDLSVVGFDNISLASVMHPALTTVALPICDLGQTAVHILFRRLKEKNTPIQRQTLDIHLIIRESTAPIPASKK